MVGHLPLQILEQIGKPLERVGVRTDPEEVDFAQFYFELWVLILVP